MNIYNNTLPGCSGCVVIIGMFDGCHLGHKKLLSTAIEYGRNEGLPVTVITFSNHPLSITAPHNVPRLLTTKEEKLCLFKEAGVENVCVMDFTHSFSAITAEAFLLQLKTEMDIRCLFMGQNFRMGHGAKGNREVIEQLGQEYGFVLKVIEPKMYLDQPISSTRIRRSIQIGELKEAAKMLGYNYSMCGRVVRGRQIGSSIGFPTANLRFDGDKLVPQNGVYCTNAHLDGVCYPGITNIGKNPTVTSEDQLSIETHIFGVSGLLYEEQLCV